MHGLGVLMRGDQLPLYKKSRRSLDVTMIHSNLREPSVLLRGLSCLYTTRRFSHRFFFERLSRDETTFQISSKDTTCLSVPANPSDYPM